MQLTDGLGYGDLLCLNSLHHDFPVFGQFQRWPPKLDVFLFRRINPLTLSASDFQAFILCNAPKHFNQNRIDHIHDPHLFWWKVGQCSGNVEDFDMNAFALEKLQFLLDVRFTSAESVQFLNHQRIAAPENLLFQILIALTLSAVSYTHLDVYKRQ